MEVEPLGIDTCCEFSRDRASCAACLLSHIWGAVRYTIKTAKPTDWEVPTALSGPAHYAKAGQLLAAIEASPTISNETETSLATRAVAHATLAAAAAIALRKTGPDSRAWQKTVGTRLDDRPRAERNQKAPSNGGIH